MKQAGASGWQERGFLRRGLAALLLAAPMLLSAQADPVQQWVQAHAAPMPAPTAAQISDAQLRAFGEAVGGARVVALGEQTHGGREEFELRLRLLRYLHEHKGFDLLLLESGVFDIALLDQAMRQQGAKLDASAPGNVFFMYANSDAGRELMRYVDERQGAPRPLQLAGIDSQLSGALSRSELLPRLRAHLPEAVAGDWPLFARWADTLMAMDRRAPPAAEQRRFEAVAAALGGALCGNGKGDQKGERALLCRSLAGLQAQAAGFWRGDYQRDHEMAANVLWQLEHLYPGRKAVVWGHIIHLARGVKLDAQHRFAGDILGERLGRDYYVLNTTALQGNFLEFASGQVHPIPPAYPRSLEALLARDPAGFIFLNAPGAGTPQRDRLAAVSSRAMEFGYGLPNGVASGLGVQWDGVFYIRDMQAVKMVR